MNNENKVYKIIMLVILTAVVTFMLTCFGMYKYFSKNQNLTSDTSTTTTSGSSSLENYLKNIKNVLDKYYLWNDNIDEDKLETGAIEGYVAGLGDEYTEYIPADEMEDYKESITGNFVGIGIYMVADTTKDKVVVYYPIADCPAEKAGIKAGDYIISVNGKEYHAEDLEEMADNIKGEEGTTVTLVVERDGEQLTFNVTRAKINTSPVSSKMVNDNIGYINIPSFDEGTADSFKTELQELQNNGMTNLIIDLRNNGGGIVDEATNIADYLLDKDKTIMSTVDNKDNTEITKSKENPIFTGKIVVLVNSNSASASEILTGALKDNSRATIVGTKTYGKGIIQSFLSLSDGSGLKITTEEYSTPNGTKINKVGITPDVVIELPSSATNSYYVSEENDTQYQKAIELLK